MLGIGVGVLVMLGLEVILALDRRSRRRQLSSDYCRVCDRQLEVGRVWELREHWANDDPEMTVGGTFGAIPYCRRHRPRGAVRA